MTLWTDWAYPMLTFNLFLTGYDMQSINLYDVFTRGAIAPDRAQFPILPITGPSLPPSCDGEPTVLPPQLLHDLQEDLPTGGLD